MMHRAPARVNVDPDGPVVEQAMRAVAVYEMEYSPIPPAATLIEVK
jgi:hypothetical protein